MTIEVTNHYQSIPKGCNCGICNYNIPGRHHECTGYEGYCSIRGY